MIRTQLALLHAVLFVSVSACAGPSAGQRVCPEYREIRCMTRLECDYSTTRGCEVCRCAEPGNVPPGRD